MKTWVCLRCNRPMTLCTCERKSYTFGMPCSATVMNKPELQELCNCKECNDRYVCFTNGIVIL